MLAFLAASFYFLCLQAATPAHPGDAGALVDAAAMVSGLQLDIRYATENNFTKTRLYDVARCLLRPKTAHKLAKAQKLLKKKGYALKAFDCYRPFSAQKAMWAKVPVRGLVASPAAGGSNHNRGAAVDVSLARLDGTAVEMPTDFDDFGKAARINSRLPTEEAQRHRTILQDAMTRAGFATMYMEWWHFDDPDALDYPTLDVPLDASLPPPPVESDP
jgi:zinc D-Ala-D-Ala dipeptidase